MRAIGDGPGRGPGGGRPIVRRNQPPGTAVAASLAHGAGVTFAGMFGLVRRFRSRPLHPHGVVLSGTLTLQNASAPGVQDLGGPGELRVRVRVSRAAGLPRWLPDNQGLAITWGSAERRHDLLLASSGLGRLGRFALVPRWRPVTGPLSTLMPFIGSDGRRVVLAVVPTSSSRTRALGDPATGGGLDLTILSAHPRSGWTQAGSLSVPPSPAGDPPADDLALRFHPIENVPGTLAVPAWAALVRRPVYRRAQT